MAKRPRKQEDVGEIEVPLNFNIPVGMPSVYATNLIVQASQYEVVISFYEAQPPFLPAPADLETLKQIGMRADCVARITISNDRISGFAAIIKQVADQIEQSRK